MKTLLVGLGSLLLASTSLVGCATESSDSECLPGDADCNDTPISDGKADGFDWRNDPSAMSQHLQYNLAALPKKGFRETPAWKDSYPEAVGRAETIWADTY